MREGLLLHLAAGHCGVNGLLLWWQHRPVAALALPAFCIVCGVWEGGVAECYCQCLIRVCLSCCPWIGCVGWSGLGGAGLRSASSLHAARKTPPPVVP